MGLYSIGGGGRERERFNPFLPPAGLIELHQLQQKVIRGRPCTSLVLLLFVYGLAFLPLWTQEACIINLQSPWPLISLHQNFFFLSNLDQCFRNCTPYDHPCQISNINCTLKPGFGLGHGCRRPSSASSTTALALGVCGPPFLLAYSLHKYYGAIHSDSSTFPSPPHSDNCYFSLSCVSSTLPLISFTFHGKLAAIPGIRFYATTTYTLCSVYLTQLAMLLP